MNLSDPEGNAADPILQEQITRGLKVQFMGQGINAHGSSANDNGSGSPGGALLRLSAASLTFVLSVLPLTAFGNGEYSLGNLITEEQLEVGWRSDGNGELLMAMA